MSWDDARRGYRILVAAALSILATGTVVYHYLEDWSWVDSLYFSSVAVTTVGFGDLTPTSDGAKLFTVAYIFAGIAIITSYINVTLKVRGMKLKNR
ncbi:MAG: potassium channel family protein [Actinomycetota bacterium]|nr:potassium channel family protein [Actinomycetota bacterium]